MQGIVAMVDKLAELDLGDITDVINTERKNAFHEDEVIQEYTPDKLIEPNARTSSAAAWQFRVLSSKEGTEQMALYEKTASELSELLGKKEISAVELAKDVFARTKAVEDKVQGYVTVAEKSSTSAGGSC